jgi:transglutaminase-like putative cysteine protease
VQISVSHTTRYRFETAPAHGLQRLRLKPKSSHGQIVHAWNMTIEGATVQAAYEDHNHNQTALISFTDDTKEIAVTCEGLVQTADSAGVIGPHTGFMPLWAFLDQTELTRPGPRLRALAAGFRGKGISLELLHELSATVHAAVHFEVGRTDATTTAEMALAAGKGVCQDHAHIFIGAARLLDIPARYISGYLLMDELTEQQAGHGWAEAHVEGLGWVGFDVANGICPDERYVRVASGCDYRDAAPVTGISLGAGNSEMSVRLEVAEQAPSQQHCQQQAKDDAEIQAE